MLFKFSYNILLSCVTVKATCWDAWATNDVWKVHQVRLWLSVLEYVSLAWTSFKYAEGATTTHVFSAWLFLICWIYSISACLFCMTCSVITPWLRIIISFPRSFVLCFLCSLLFYVAWPSCCFGTLVISISHTSHFCSVSLFTCTSCWFNSFFSFVLCFLCFALFCVVWASYGSRVLFVHMCLACVLI